MSEELKALREYPDVNFIDNYTCEQLAADMVSWFREKKKEITGKDVTLAAADDNRILLLAGAYYIFQGYMHIDNAAKMGLLKYSVGKYLENLGALKRVERKAASAATTEICFEMDEIRESATGIRAGTRVTAGDGVYFATDEYAEISAGETKINVPATCTIKGAAGNIYAIGEINKMVDNVAFIDRVYNVTTSDNGADIESDEDYREDIYLAPDSYSSAGSEAAYRYYVHRFNNAISEVRVTSPSPRVVEIMCLLDGGALMSEEAITELQEKMNQSDVRMLTDMVIIRNPDVTEYELELTYYINQSDKNRALTIQAAVEKAVNEWVIWQRSAIGRDMNPNELVRKILVAGAKRVEIVSPSFAVIADDHIAVLSSDSKITYGGLEND
ncbi:baseplate J/gp47 family protein [Lachnospiraceae bacterium 45-P1]